MQTESLIAAIERHETLAESYGGDGDDRTEALNRYLGRPMGNEIEGRSQVVSRDVWDTVEWLKPQLAEVFCGGEQVVSFAPRGPEDVQAAQQESEYIDHVITEKNNWFEIFTNWQHDALLQKNGYVMAYWDEREDRSVEEYEGLTGDELALVAQDQGVEIVSGMQNQDGTYNVKLARTRVYGCARLVNIPPERVKISHNARGLSLQDPAMDFVEYEERKTISQLRDEGFKVDDDLSDHTGGGQEWEENNRDDANPFRNHGDDGPDPAARLLRVRNVWIRFDADGDGRSELHRVVVVGKTILQDDECDEVTLYALCPIPLPHQHTGLSVADSVMDLEKIATALLRGALDNVYLANNGRYAIDANRVELDDMLVSRPGGVVRTKGDPGTAIVPLQHTQNGQVAVPMLEYIDRLRQKRTGVSESMQGLNSNSLNNSLGAQTNMAMVTAAQQRLKHIARTFAETGVKSLFRGVHMLTLKHARGPEQVQLGNQWSVVDPREWKKRESLKIKIGNVDLASQMAFLMQLIGLQAQAAPFGLSSPPKVFNAMKRLTKAGGYADPLEFFDDPATKPPPPPQPPIELLKVQAQGQVQGQIEQMKIQAELQAKREENAMKMRELEAQLALQQSNDMRDADREALKAEYDKALETERLLMERWKVELQAQIDNLTNQRDNETKLAIAGMSTEVQREGQQLQVGHDAMQKSEDRTMQKELKAKEAEAPKQAADQTKQTMAQVTAAIEKLAKMQAQIVEGQNKLEAAVRAKRVLVRDDQGRASHSEIRE